MANNKMANINKIRDTIETAIEVSRDSGVPCLLIANPGMAKSTIVTQWARRNGYHVETLIGTRFTQEDILGFQVRNEDKENGTSVLELLEPHWYRNIILQNSCGKKSLLFLDELSTVQENVQGAMLQLIFERTIGHGKTLPPSTLIIAAANYKQNIPVFFNIMAPILNRFCIVNLQYETFSLFLDEFLQDETDRDKNLIAFNRHIDSHIDKKVDAETSSAVRFGLKNIFKTIFETFKSTPDSCNINNQAYNNIYETDSEYVYNFLSGRTLYYLQLVTISFLRLGLTLKDHARIIVNMVFGLVGLGTNSFNELQQKSYLKLLEKLYLEFYARLTNCTYNENNLETKRLDFTDKTVSLAIDEWLLYKDADQGGGGSGGETSGEEAENLKKLLRHIENTYPISEEEILNLSKNISADKNKLYFVMNDFAKIDLLLNVLIDR
ncbi:MAG: hypothetical protein Ta2B_20640 [Termitinemataceae bacterium]|nr:MAG: hypothetical protein Ta2B_20640 [Termitinemataceae bacterium]